MKKILLILLTVVLLIVPARAISASSVAFSETFVVNTLFVVGTHSGGAGQQVTSLITKAGFDPKNIDISKILWLNQFETGVNGAFAYTAGIGLRDEDITIQMGGTDVDVPTTKTTHISSSPATVDYVLNNSLRIGNDIYDLSGRELTADMVAISLKNGGNKLAFKIGNRWYDLLDSKATSSKYLIPENAIPDSEVKAWTLDKWFINGMDINFDN